MGFFVALFQAQEKNARQAGSVSAPPAVGPEEPKPQKVRHLLYKEDDIVLIPICGSEVYVDWVKRRYGFWDKLFKELFTYKIKTVLI